ncbi:hypothetical protein EIP91_006813 [Steccherinum ochraceum]|uniref:Enoyl reductase (ER) domain-containing protein n=1 Tax=Steccherinum ochraceum TaxID=92696 RepID=A0A4R0R5B0_9APHY|nr:hypothetical protein EIP91_006813 [Steccherinum ochraceum]
MSLPNSQQTLALTTKQGAWELYSYFVDKPEAGEIAVRIEATALNPIDWKVQATSYHYFLKEYPAIRGSDAAGVVAAVGEGVTNFAVGDRVDGYRTSTSRAFQGSFTNRLATFKHVKMIAAKVPDNITLDQAATIPSGLAAAAVALYNTDNGIGLVAPWTEGGRGKYRAQPFVLFGGSTSVGQFVLQLAQLSGFSPIITTASSQNFELVKSLGATHTIDRSLSADKIAAAVKEITAEPVKVVYDAISLESTQLQAYSVLSPGGSLILVLASLIPEDQLSADKKIVSTLGNFHPQNNRELGKGLYANLTKYLETGEIKPNAVEVLPNGLIGIVDGLARLQADKVSGRKLVVHPQETQQTPP